MGELMTLLQELSDTSAPNTLIVAGIVFIFLAVVGQFAGKITVEPGQKKLAGLVGTLFLFTGISLYLVPSVQSADIGPYPPGTSIFQLPTNTPMPAPTITPTFTPTFTPTPTETKVPTPSPEQSVKDYWNFINAHQYEKSWAMLSSAFKARNHPKGITTYVDWADTIHQVDVIDVETLMQTDAEATVKMHILFRMKDGKTLDYNNFYFQFDYDVENHGWLIYKTWR